MLAGWRLLPHRRSQACRFLPCPNSTRNVIFRARDNPSANSNPGVLMDAMGTMFVMQPRAGAVDGISAALQLLRVSNSKMSHIRISVAVIPVLAGLFLAVPACGGEPPATKPAQNPPTAAISGE